MAWDGPEVKALGGVLDRVVAALGPLEGKHVLVLCSAGGDVAFRLIPLVGDGTVVGLELHEPSLARARARAAELGAGHRLRFGKAARGRIPFPFGSFEALVSEFVVHRSPEPTEIGQAEMARVVRHGGRIVLTDVLAPAPLPPEVREPMRESGLDYVCDASRTHCALGWRVRASSTSPSRTSPVWSGRYGWPGRGGRRRGPPNDRGSTYCSGRASTRSGAGWCTCSRAATSIEGRLKPSAPNLLRRRRHIALVAS